jgi:hypothetical protein
VSWEFRRRNFVSAVRHRPGITYRLWEIADIVAMVETNDPKAGHLAAQIQSNHCPTPPAECGAPEFFSGAGSIVSLR